MNIALNLLKNVICLVLSTAFLQSCVNVDHIDTKEPVLSLTSENTGDFGLRPAIISPEEIHQLTTAQTEDFLTFMASPRNASLKPHRRLFSYLEKIVSGFNYQKITYTATQAIELNSGNCLSLAILTTALAKAANLEIDYQLMNDAPVFELNDTIIEKGVHIRTLLYDPTWVGSDNLLYFSRPGIKIDYFPTGRQRFIANLNENDYLAMYYQNEAVEAIAQNDLNAAYWFSIEMLKYVPNNSQAINMLAVINRRAGNPEIAEQLYLFGIEFADEKLSLLKNYHLLLSSAGRIEEAERIEIQLNSMNDPSPFNWFQLAVLAYDEGDFIKAIRYYNKAIELAPYLHEAHLGIAQSNYQVGRLRSAENALKRALDNVYKVSTRNLYQAKLVSLSKEIHN